MSNGSTEGTIKARAAELAEDTQTAVNEAAESKAEELRDDAVSEADRMADAADAASEEFDSDSLQAQAMRHVSSQIESATATLRDKPVDELMDDVALFARRNPLLFLGGAALAGFAAARFLKSGSGSSAHTYAERDPWEGHLSYDGGTQ